MLRCSPLSHRTRRYNKLTGYITSLVAKLKLLPPDNGYRISATQRLLDKCCAMGLIDSAASLAKLEKLSASAFARRRLPVVMVRLRMSETLKEAVTFIETGQVRVGPEVMNDAAFLVSRSLEDMVTWVDRGKVRRTVAQYNDKLDDFDLLGL